MKNYHKTRVLMIKDDDWGQRGWTGTLHSGPDGNIVSVRWDNGKILSHMRSCVTLLGEEGLRDPNTIFMLRKHNNEV